jgi:hypothetical protein
MNLEDKSIIVYAITKEGPNIVHANSSLKSTKLQEIALYHLLLVAQGTWHHKGIFLLPVPVTELKDDHKAIFYGFQIFDPEQNDPRTNKTRYGCVIVFVSNDVIQSINILEIQNIFDKHFEKIPSFQVLSSKTCFSNLQKLVNKKIFQKKKIDNSNFLGSMSLNQLKL